VFTLFFIGIATVVFIATTHREYLVSDNYYEREIGYQNQMDSAARARECGASLTYDPATTRVVISIPGAQFFQNCTGKIEFYRPSSPELDREYPLDASAHGPQTIDASRLAAGLWKVKATWRAGGQDYYLDQRIVVAEK
jgi:nitrogen fixation protein FixH